MAAKAMRVDSAANEVVRLVRSAIREADTPRPQSNRRNRNGDGIPLFAWLRAARVYANGSPVMHITQESEHPPRLGVLLSRTEAAACVVRRLSRSNPLTAVQLRLLHELLTSRYGGTRCRRPDKEWESESPFREIYAVPWSGFRVSPSGLEYRLMNHWIAKGISSNPSAAAVLTSRRLTDALLMAHLYATAKPGVAERI